MIELQVDGKKAKTIGDHNVEYSSVQIKCGGQVLDIPLGYGDVLIEVDLIPRPVTDLGLQTEQKAQEQREQVEQNFSQEALDIKTEIERVEAEEAEKAAAEQAEIDAQAAEAISELPLDLSADDSTDTSADDDETKEPDDQA